MNCILFTFVVGNISQLDPENARTTLEVIKQQEKPKVEEQRTVTFEELREKLHKRIELLRSKRHADAAASTAKSAKDLQTEKTKDSEKRNRKSKVPEEDGLKPPSAKRPKLQAKADMVYLHCLVCSSLITVMYHLAIAVALKMLDSVQVQLAHCRLFPCFPAFTSCWKAECWFHLMATHV